MNLIHASLIVASLPPVFVAKWCDDSPKVSDTSDSTQADTAPADTGPTDTGGTPGEVHVSRTHWKKTFGDEFRGKTGKPSDDYCFDVLKPQCHIWPGGNFDCDQQDNPNEGPFPPTRANMVAAIKLFDRSHDFGTLSLPEVKSLYGQILDERLAGLDKCTWTLYTMVNWMATDYAGHWSARFDASQVEVDTSGKGTLELSATYAPVDASCIFGGSGGDPNCQIVGFQPGVLTPGVHYWVDPDPRWAGVYYAPVGGACPYGGTFSGVNCFVYGFQPNVLEPHDVAYWADADARWPGVYYANRTYACRDNIDYSPNLGFRNLTCPILDGGLNSYPPQHSSWVDGGGTPHTGGATQFQGRFEAKARIPKGLGAFPATWLMPTEGGWPYDGGEIDVMEARDAADEIYQTFHSGRCYRAGTATEIDADDSGDCTAKGGVTTHMSKGYTILDRQTDEFWKRDHLFAVEWTGDGNSARLDYYINNVKTGSVTVGMNATLDAGAPPSLAPFSSENFPSSPFYWILNHSTWVAPDKQASFAQQVFQIDYVRNYVACGSDEHEYCPTGGTFREGVGCDRGDHTAPYASPCQPATRTCVNGGDAVGSRCRAWTFEANQVRGGVAYWVDADPRWPGVFYAKVNGGCPYGGSGTVNCQLVGLPGDVLETGVSYVVDTSTTPPGIFYTPDFRN